MAHVMQVTVSRVDAPLFQGEAISLTVPGVEGEMTILPHHSALLTPLKTGTVTVRTDSGGTQVIAIERGVCEVSNNQVTVLL